MVIEALQKLVLRLFLNIGKGELGGIHCIKSFFGAVFEKLSNVRIIASGTSGAEQNVAVIIWELMRKGPDSGSSGMLLNKGTAWRHPGPQKTTADTPIARQPWFLAWNQLNPPLLATEPNESLLRYVRAPVWPLHGQALSTNGVVFTGQPSEHDQRRVANTYLASMCVGSPVFGWACLLVPELGQKSGRLPRDLGRGVYEVGGRCASAHHAQMCVPAPQQFRGLLSN